MSDKLKFVKKLTAESDIWTVSDAMDYWWQNTQGGWRLTSDGFRALKQYGLECWEFEVPRMAPTPGLLLALDRKLSAPYYLNIGKKTSICFFSSKEATMYALYGDIKRFISAINSGPDVRNRA